jgi:hypothetical protein
MKCLTSQSTILEQNAQAAQVSFGAHTLALKERSLICYIQREWLSQNPAVLARVFSHTHDLLIVA